VEGVLRRAVGRSRGTELKVAGVVLVVVIVAGAYLAAFAALSLGDWVIPGGRALLSVYIVWTCISVRSLADEANGVLEAMGRGDIETARKRLSRIVGRDTTDLVPAEICRAASETVAENTSDGVVAPLFYLAIGGPALMLAYKAVNTLDSMTGYRDERYLDFGWCAARLDDAANYVPARITALFMVAAAYLLGYDWRGAMRTVERDGLNHSSPNAGLPEAAVAGATGVRFGGPATYGGVEEERPFIGEARVEHSADTVVAAIRILYLTALIAVLGTPVLRFMLYTLL
jgi:adenosylcobinamide-phosphate synthase